MSPPTNLALTEALEQGTLTLFIGADLPRDATGLPSRAELARELSHRLGTEEALSLAEAAERMIRAGNRFELLDFIRNQLDTTGKTPQSVHQKLAALVNTHHIQTIITTAYDDLIDTALRQAGIPFDCVVSDTDIVLARSDRLTLIKLYGEVRQPDTLVVTYRDHNLLLRDRRKEGLIDAVKQTFKRSTVFLYGYTLDDTDFRLLFDQAADDRFAHPFYAVWPGLPDPEVQTWLNLGMVTLPESPFDLPTLMPERIPGLKPPPRPRTRWILVVAALAAIIAVLGIALIINSQLKPMSPGFNVAVAQFTEVDPNGQLSVTQTSRDLSDKVYKALYNENASMPNGLKFGLLSPDEVGPVTGASADQRDKMACELARQRNIVVFVYGALTPIGNGNYQLQPGFCVNDVTFLYGDELRGPNQLGTTLLYQPASGESAKFETQRELNGRLNALRKVAKGLALFYIANYQDALDAFQLAANEPDWAEDQGKQVVYLLLGATQLRQYDPVQPLLQRVEVLTQSNVNFTLAYTLNRAYARSYLGLGAVALLQANLSPTQTNGAKLVEAISWYDRALKSQGQPAAAHIDIKAHFGLGEAYLLLSNFPTSGIHDEQAQSEFEKVIAAYEVEQLPDLGWMAGHAMCFMGKLAERQRDWGMLASWCRRGVQVLEDLPGDPPTQWLSLYWGQIGYAEEHLSNFKEARSAYQNAIQYQRARLTPTMADTDGYLQCWESHRNRLLTPPPTGGQYEPSDSCDHAVNIIH